jgi:AcrR family transcriptional regulator
MQKDVNQRVLLSRDRWLELALATMADEGKSKFSLDALIRAMPVSKGSFYHHFRSRAEFLLALAEYWDRHETQNVIEALEALPEETSAEDRLWELMCVVFETLSAQHESLIRAMAREFPEVRKRVEAVDQKRMGAVRSLFAAMGFADDELEMRTLAFVTTTSLDHQIFSGLSRDDYRRQLRLRHEFFERKAENLRLPSWVVS